MQQCLADVAGHAMMEQYKDNIVCIGQDKMFTYIAANPWRNNLLQQLPYVACKHTTLPYTISKSKQEVKVIWQKAPHGGPIPRLGVTPGGRNLYHWIPVVGFPISVP